MNSEIQVKLTELAFKRSKPFCYQCHKAAIAGGCETCGSDDLMRISEEDGPEYGTDWTVENILNTELSCLNIEELFEQSISDCYSEITKIGRMELDTVSVLKNMDPVSWRCAHADWGSQEAEGGTIISFDNGTTFYLRDDVENLIEKQGSQLNFSLRRIFHKIFRNCDHLLRVFRPLEPSHFCLQSEARTGLWRYRYTL